MQVVVLAFGENFPAAGGQGITQAFSLAIASAGLVSFALVLALVEQVVLENVEQNVKKGSPIITTGHVGANAWECAWPVYLACILLARIRPLVLLTCMVALPFCFHTRVRAMPMLHVSPADATCSIYSA